MSRLSDFSDSAEEGVVMVATKIGTLHETRWRALGLKRGDQVVLNVDTARLALEKGLVRQVQRSRLECALHEDAMLLRVEAC